VFTLYSLAFNEPEEYKQGVSSRSSGGTMTPPGLELHDNWSHRFCGARRSRNIRALSALPSRHSKI